MDQRFASTPDSRIREMLTLSSFTRIIAFVFTFVTKKINHDPIDVLPFVTVTTHTHTTIRSTRWRKKNIVVEFRKCGLPLNGVVTYLEEYWWKSLKATPFTRLYEEAITCYQVWRFISCIRRQKCHLFENVLNVAMDAEWNSSSIRCTNNPRRINVNSNEARNRLSHAQ